MLISSNLCSHTKLVYTTYVWQCYHPHHRKITSSFWTMLRFSASVGFRLLWWMKNLHLSFKTLQVPLRSPCNLHNSFTINVQLDSLRCSKTLAMIIFLNCDNGIGQVSKFTCQPSKWMQRSFNYIHSGISKAQKRKFSWICIILASSLYCYLSVHFFITLSLLLLMALRL